MMRSNCPWVSWLFLSPPATGWGGRGWTWAPPIVAEFLQTTCQALQWIEVLLIK